MRSRGTACVALWVLSAAALQAQTFTILHTFMGGPDDGALPLSRPLPDASGNLYGTTEMGGSFNYCSNQYWNACGTVYKLNGAGVITVLHSFGDVSGRVADGVLPNAGLVKDGAGTLYGTTQFGGNYRTLCPASCGMVFAVTSSGHEAVLHDFVGADGANPQAGLVRDAAGNLYGTTAYGGIANCNDSNGQNGCGVVFKLAAHTWKATVLHAFSGGSDGAHPSWGVVLDSAGNIYGITPSGGTGACNGGCGRVFKIDASGNSTTVYSFKGSPDASYPLSLAWNARTNIFYGTSGGGANNGGAAFEMDSTGNESLLYSFLPIGTNEVQGVNGGLVLDPAGNLYGTTQFGGDDLSGSAFKVDPFGNYTLLYAFTGGADGAFPKRGLSIDPTGVRLYGATFGGGSASGYAGAGVIFEIGLQ